MVDVATVIIKVASEVVFMPVTDDIVSKVMKKTINCVQDGSGKT